MFENHKIFLGNGCKGIDEKNLENIKKSNGIFIFVDENSQKIKKIKSLINKDKDSCLIDCYELEKESKIKILKKFLSNSGLNVSQEVYWLLIDKLDNRYGFFENSLNQIILEKGIGISNTWDTGGGFVRKVSTASDGSTNVTYYYEYYDVGTSLIVEVFQDKLITPITNYEYEEDLENKKRNIFLLKPQYINVAIDDLEEMMVYEKGSTQYKSRTLKRADNIRLYE